MKLRSLRADEFQASFLCTSKVTLGPSPVTCGFVFPFPLLPGRWEGRTLLTLGAVSQGGAGVGGGELG